VFTVVLFVQLFLFFLSVSWASRLGYRLSACCLFMRATYFISIVCLSVLISPDIC